VDVGCGQAQSVLQAACALGAPVAGMQTEAGGIRLTELNSPDSLSVRSAMLRGCSGYNAGAACTLLSAATGTELWAGLSAASVGTNTSLPACAAAQPPRHTVHISITANVSLAPVLGTWQPDRGIVSSSNSGNSSGEQFAAAPRLLLGCHVSVQGVTVPGAPLLELDWAAQPALIGAATSTPSNSSSQVVFSLTNLVLYNPPLGSPQDYPAGLSALLGWAFVLQRQGVNRTAAVPPLVVRMQGCIAPLVMPEVRGACVSDCVPLCGAQCPGKSTITAANMHPNHHQFETYCRRAWLIITDVLAHQCGTV